MLVCPVDGLQYESRGGIWRLLDPEREAALRTFIEGYQRQREGEGWGSPDPGYYLNLPYKDTTGRHADLWRTRAHHMRRLFDALGPVLARRGTVMLDAGAGNCWLSYRLARQGARVVAIDLNDDTIDGLAVAEVYRSRAGVDIATAQAELERIPVATEMCDAVVFNASLHYAANPAAAIAEGWRVLKPGGLLTIMDSPVYHGEAAGEKMVREWSATYAAREGHPPATLPGKGYLTYKQVSVALQTAGFRRDRVRLVPERTALRALLHAVRARLAPADAARYREVATHPIWVAER